MDFHVSNKDLSRRMERLLTGLLNHVIGIMTRVLPVVVGSGRARPLLKKSVHHSALKGQFPSTTIFLFPTISKLK